MAIIRIELGFLLLYVSWWSPVSIGYYTVLNYLAIEKKYLSKAIVLRVSFK